MAPPGMEEMTNQLQGMFQNMAGDKRTKRKLKIKEAFKLLTEEEAGKLVNPEELKEQGVEDFQLHYALETIGRLGPEGLKMAMNKAAKKPAKKTLAAKN